MTEQAPKQITSIETVSSSPVEHLRQLGDESLTKLQRRESGLMERAVGNMELTNRLLQLTRAAREKVALAVGVAALASSSLAFAQESPDVEKITSLPTMEASSDVELPAIDLGNVEVVISGLEYIVKDKVATVTSGVEKIASSDTFASKLDAVEEVTKRLPGRIGKIGESIEHGKKVLDKETGGEERLMSGVKILEMAGSKVGPLGALLSSGLEIKKDIADGKGAKEIAFKFVKLIVGIKTAGIGTIIANTLVGMAERTTLAPTLSLQENIVDTGVTNSLEERL